MRRLVSGHVLSMLVVLAVQVAPASAQSTTGAADVDEVSTSPIPIDLVEEENVRLIVLDVLVVDSKGRTVPGLTKDDFEIVAGGRPTDPDTLDVRCDEALDDARAVKHARQRESPATADGGGKIVLAFDYLHLGLTRRAEVLDYAKDLVRHGDTNGEEIMLAALNGGLRIEQTFTEDRDRVGESLNRMQHDITLWSPDFFHQSEIGWVSGLTALFDVLGTVPGPKKVVFFSEMTDVPLDLQFRELAAQAAVSRSSVYPVDAAGLTTLEQDKGRRAAQSGSG